MEHVFEAMLFIYIFLVVLFGFVSELLRIVNNIS